MTSRSCNSRLNYRELRFPLGAAALHEPFQTVDTACSGWLSEQARRNVSLVVPKAGAGYASLVVAQFSALAGDLGNPLVTLLAQESVQITDAA